MLETKERQIGGIAYKVSQLPALEGRRLLVRLYKVLGPVIGAALSGLPESNEASLGDITTSAIGDAFSKLAQTISEDELDHLVKVMTGVTQYSPGPDKWLPLKQDELSHWSGRYLEMFKWLGFCLEVNYSDFLSGLEGLKGLLSAASQKGDPSSSQSALTGTSTGSPAADTTPAA